MMYGSIIPSRMKDVLQKSADNYEPRGRLDPAGFERHVSFHTYPPPDDLTPFIEHFWTIRWDEADNTYYSEEVMHRPYVDVFVSLQQFGIQGTVRGKRTYVATGSGRIIGIRFRQARFMRSGMEPSRTCKIKSWIYNRYFLRQTIITSNTC